MSTPSKFTADRREVILELLGAGASRRAAAAAARIDHATLGRWIGRGEKAAPEGRWRSFYEAVQEAEAHPSIRALERAQDRMLADPLKAMRFLERSEPEIWGRPREGPVEPVVIQLHWQEPPRVLPPDDDEGDEDG